MRPNNPSLQYKYTHNEHDVNRPGRCNHKEMKYIFFLPMQDVVTTRGNKDTACSGDLVSCFSAASEG